MTSYKYLSPPMNRNMMNQSNVPKQKLGVFVRCNNESCNKEWLYRGNGLFYATCPCCRRNVKLSENKIKVPQSFEVGARKKTVAVAPSTLQELMHDG
jgi:hypothetical protein